MQREDVTFSSGGEACAAWLYRPADASGPVPVVVLGHGLGAVREMGLDAFARRFVEAGFAALAFDYRGFGDSDGRSQWLDVRRQLADWRAAITYARGIDGVDPRRVAIWGSSFGGGHVIRTAAAVPVAAAIAQCPFTSGPASLLALGMPTATKLMPAALHDLVGARLGRRPRGIAVVGPPGSTALMNAPDADPGYRALVPDGLAFDDHVDGRIALHIPFEVPGLAAAKVTAPILFSVCEHDSVAPAKATLRFARKAPRGEVKTYPIGHFDLYSGPDFDRVVADQVAFLERHLR